MRGEIALKIYAFIWQYETSNPKTPYSADKLFDDVYAAFVNNADNANWLNHEIAAARTTSAEQPQHVSWHILTQREARSAWSPSMEA